MQTAEWEPIAIVGLACRLPGASTAKDFWQLLEDGRSAQSEVPSSRFNASAFAHPNQARPGSFVCSKGYFLPNDPRHFDPSFFGITPSEAISLDPTQRQFLEVAYECLESCGLSLTQTSGTRTGCFVGNMNDDFIKTQARDPDNLLPYVSTGGSISIISNRINYAFNWTGPSLTLDTACSSSLYALHLACEALHANDCDAALVGGTNLILSVDAHLQSSKLGALSPTSTCHTFDEAADGYARAEGITAIYVKRLSDAISAGDPIRSIIRSTAFNANGRTPGITHPSSTGQMQCMRMAYSRVPFEAIETPYVEAHGTGTPTGDPIESRAIGEFFAVPRGCDPLLIGSVKTNIGHTESSSGIASIIKCVLALERGEIPATIGINKLNPKIDFKGLNIQVVRQKIPWPAGRRKRISVNSFGFGGTNAHVILEAPDEYFAASRPPSRLSTPRCQTPNGRVNGYLNGRVNGFTNGYMNRHTNAYSSGYTSEYINRDIKLLMDGFRNGYVSPPNGLSSRVSLKGVTLTNGKLTSNGWCSPALPVLTNGFHPGALTPAHHLLVFSGNTEHSLQKNIENIRHALAAQKLDLRSVAHTLERRAQHFYRSFAVVSDEKIDLKVVTGKRAQKDISIALVFTGQGALWAGAGIELMECYPSFLQDIRVLDTYLAESPHRPPWSIEEKIYDPALDPSNVIVSQTVCTAIQIGLVNLMRRWGITPKCVVGHSSGEIAAAYASKRLSARSAILSAYLRGLCVSQASIGNGKMLAVGVGTDQISPYLEGSRLRIACFNSPASVTLSGEGAEVDDIKAKLDADKIFNRLLATGGAAYHSKLMYPCSQLYQGLLEEELGKEGPVRTSETLTMYSSAKGKLLDPEETLGPDYWVTNLISPVQFQQAASNMLLSAQPDLLIEIGPHSALQGALVAISRSLSSLPELPQVLPTLKRRHDSEEKMLELAGELFVAGCLLDLKSVLASQQIPGTPRLRILHELPPYAWNHSQVFWKESRLSRQIDQRTTPRHDLLGSLLPGSADGHVSTWRNMLSLADAPWLLDHVVDEDVVFPAAGYLAMANEAAKQVITSRGKDPDEYQISLCDVHITDALRLPQDTGSAVETLMSLMPRKVTGATFSTRHYDFIVSSVKSAEDDTAHKHCYGTIKIEDTTAPGAVQTTLLPVDPLLTSMRGSFGKKRWYKTFSSAGLSYGPAFQGLEEIKSAPGIPHAISVIDHESSSSRKKLEHQSSYSVHPTAIDSALQLGLIACHKGVPHDLTSALLPVFLEKVTFFGRANVESLTGTASASQKGQRTYSFDIDILHRDTRQAVLQFRGLRATKVSAKRSEIASARTPYMRLVSKPDISVLPEDKLRSLFPAIDPPLVGNGQRVMDVIERLSLCIILHLTAQRDHFYDSLNSQDMKMYFDWMRDVSRACTDEELKRMGFADRERFIESHSHVSAVEVRTVLHVYRGLQSKIVARQSLDNAGFELMFSDEDLMPAFYNLSELAQASFRQASQVVDLLAHKNPKMRILEVGGGTGGTTSVMLGTLQGESQFPRYKSYTFSDVGPAFLSKAEEKFQANKRMSYKVIDAEVKPEEQGLTEDIAKYDLIMATNVVHATKSLRHTTGNLRRFLKPGGKLMLIETTTHRLHLAIAVGMLPQYWDGRQDERCGGPFATPTRWKEVLQSTGYENISVIDTYPDPHSLESVILATNHERPPPPITSHAGGPLILTNIRCPTSARMAEALRESFNMQGQEAKISHWLETEIPPKSRIISLVDIEGTFLADPTPTEWEHFRKIVSVASSVLWATNGRLLSGGPDAIPETARLNGIVRTMRIENPGAAFGMLDFGTKVANDPSWGVEYILGVERLLRESEIRDIEFFEEDGVVKVQRLVSDEEINAPFRSQLDRRTAEPVMRPFRDLRNAKLEVRAPGIISSLCFSEAGTEPELEKDEVLIRTEAVGLNMKDCTIATGMFDDSHLSRECAGVVEMVGSGVTDIRPGDRVMAIASGNFGTFHRAKSYYCSKLALTDDPIKMASMPVVFFSALYVFTHAFVLSPEDTILIQSAAGGLGQALIQVARATGARIFATVGSRHKVECIEALGVPSDQIFVTRDASFIPSLRSKTGGLGVDCLVSTATGETFYELFDAVAPGGAFIDVGRKEVLDGGTLNLSNFKRIGSFHTFDAARIKSRLVKRLMDRLMSLYRQNILRPVSPITICQPADIPDTMVRFNRGMHTGKFVISYQDPSTPVPTIITPSPVAFDPESSYLVVGGLGGLGRSLLQWMVTKGARHIVSLSRSGLKDSDATNCVHDLQLLGANIVVVKGDGSNMFDVAKAILSAPRPLRGVIQGAMVLKDRLISNMSLSDYLAGTDPKVRCTLHLHNLLAQAGLEKQIDFFLTTSSAASILGNTSQANYNSGNTFQDIFCQYRRSLGLAGSSISLGWIEDVGYVGVREEAQRTLQRVGLWGYPEHEFLAIIEQAIADDIARRGAPHIVSGLETHQLARLMDQGSGGSALMVSDPKLAQIFLEYEDIEACRPAVPSSGNRSGIVRNAKDLLAIESDEGRRQERWTEALMHKVGVMLYIPSEQIERSKRLVDYGVDSMVSAELRNWIFVFCGVEVSFLELLDPSMNIVDLAERIWKKAMRKGGA